MVMLCPVGYWKPKYSRYHKNQTIQCAVKDFKLTIDFVPHITKSTELVSVDSGRKDNLVKNERLHCTYIGVLLSNLCVVCPKQLFTFFSNNLSCEMLRMYCLN